MNHKKSWILAAVLGMSFVSANAGNTCVWIGESGNWNEPGNWQNGVMPKDGNGDDVRLQCEKSGATITNNLGEIKIFGIRFLGDNPVRFVSAQTVTLAFVRTYNASIIDADLHFYDDVRIDCGDETCDVDASKKATFNGDITIADNVKLRISGAHGADFNGSVIGANASIRNGGINFKSGVFSFYGPVVVKSVEQYDASQSEFRFYSAENHWEQFDSSYAVYRFMGKNSFAPEGVMNFTTAGQLAAFRGYFLYADQVANRIIGCDPGNTDGNWIVNQNDASGKDITLTLKGTDNAVTYARLKDSDYGKKLSLVWSPTGAFTQEFANRQHTMSGPITVVAGTVKVSGTGKFANVEKIVVGDNAVFDLAVTSSSALDNLSTLEFGSGAAFKVAATATTPCSKNPFVTMGMNSRFVCPAEASIAVGDLISPEGRAMRSGTYTGNGTTGTPVTWIEGAGTVVVSASGNYASWDQAVDGDWNAAGKWTGGELPSSTQTVLLMARGKSHSVSVTSPVAESPVGFMLKNDTGDTNTLYVSSSIGFTAVPNRCVEIGMGGKLVVATGGQLQWEPDATIGKNVASFFVHDGGRVEISGGALVTQGHRGKFELSGGKDAEGVLSISSGTCSFDNAYTGNGLWVSEGGRLEMRGGRLITKLYTNWYYPLTLNGGVIDMSGDAVYEVGNGYGKYFGNGLVVLRGNSMIVRSQDGTASRMFVAPQKTGDVTTIEVMGHAQWDMAGAIETSLGFGCAGARTILRHSSDATSNLGMLGIVGDVAGYGELDVESGCVKVGGYSLRIGDVSESVAETPTEVEGVVRVSGGSLIINGSQSSVTTRCRDGLLVGSLGNLTAECAGSHVYGTLEVSNGVVTNQYGFTMVGCGFGTGKVVQTGGEIIAAEYRPCAVGAFGGEGEWIVSNGISSVAASLYVGGCTVSDWGRDSIATEYPVNAEGSKGRLDVVNGVVNVGWSAYVGKTDGKGFGEVSIGPSGVFNVAGSLTFGNAKIKYVLRPDGAGQIISGDALNLGEETALEIDASALGENDAVKRFVLAKYHYLPKGGVKPENIVVRGVPKDKCRVRFTGTQLTFSKLSGLLITVR